MSLLTSDLARLGRYARELPARCDQLHPCEAEDIQMLIALLRGATNSRKAGAPPQIRRQLELHLRREIRRFVATYIPEPSDSAI